MNVLLLDQFSDPGGAQQALLELLPGMRERGWNAIVGLPGEGGLFAKVRAAGFPAERIECGPYRSGTKSVGDLGRFFLGTPELARQVLSLARRLDADVIYVNGPRLLPAVALAGLRTPVIFHSHSFLPEGPSRKLAGFALRRMRVRVLANCHFVGDIWKPYVGADCLTVVYNGVAGPASPVSGPRRLRVGCIGRIAPEKGQLEFLKVASEIVRALPECRFFIYGAALFSEEGALRYDRQVREAAAELPVEFPGWVSDVYAALSNLDLVLAPSAAHEATTRVILEAFAAGVPAIAFRSGGIPEIVEDGRTGLLCDDSAGMARLAIELLTNEERRSCMARAARESWEQRFTIQRHQSQVLGAIESAALQRPPARA